MKKVIGSLIIVLAVVSFASMSFASKSSKPSQDTPVVSQETCVVNVIGPVVSIDKANNRITVRDQSDKQNKIIIVNPAEISKLKIGDIVRFELTASPMAQAVEIMKLDKTKKGK